MVRKRSLVALLLVSLLLSGAAWAAEADGARIAFLDSGVATWHLDGAQVETGENFVLPARDTVDRIGHGTATAGLVLGSQTLGLAGLCPSAVVVPLVCYDRYPSGVTAAGDAQTMAEAIYAAVDRYDCRILNISMGLTQDVPALRKAVEYALARGAIIVSAVGNDNGTAPERVYYPAAYDGVIGVGAADGETVAGFSQRQCVDVLAPGVALETVTSRKSAEVDTRSGTSYACAYISGVCAAIWSAQPELSADAVRQTLFSMARDIGAPGYDADSGWGIVTVETDAAPGFSDVAGHWASDAIAVCAACGLLDAVEGDRFLPDAPMTRAMMASAIYHLAGAPEPDAACDFSDLAPDAPCAQAVAWCVGNGILTGYADGSFHPDATLTRQQAAAILYRYALAQGMDTGADAALSAFSDAQTVSSYAARPLSWAVGAGIVQGTGGRLAPHTGCTRAQMATMLVRFLGQ